MLHTMQAQVLALRHEPVRDDALPEAETLRERCLHPAEAWVMKRRANRPAPAPHRLPAVAPVG